MLCAGGVIFKVRKLLLYPVLSVVFAGVLLGAALHAIGMSEVVGRRECCNDGFPRDWLLYYSLLTAPRGFTCRANRVFL